MKPSRANKPSLFSRILKSIKRSPKRSPTPLLPQPVATRRTKTFHSRTPYDIHHNAPSADNSPDLLPGQLPGQLRSNLPDPAATNLPDAPMETRLDRQAIAYRDKRTNPQSRVLYSYLLRDRHMTEDTKRMFARLKALLDHRSDGGPSVNGIINLVNMKQPRPYTTSGTLTIPMVVKKAISSDSDNLNVEYLNQCILYTWQPYFPVFVEPVFQLYCPKNARQPTVKELAIDTIRRIEKREPFEALLVAPLAALEQTRVLVASVELAQPISLHAWLMRDPAKAIIHEVFRLLLFLLREWSGLLVHGDLHGNNILLEPLPDDQFICYAFQRTEGTLRFHLPFRLYIIDVARLCMHGSVYPLQLNIMMQEIYHSISGSISAPLADLKWFLAYFPRVVPPSIQAAFVDWALDTSISEHDILDNLFQRYTADFTHPTPPAVLTTFHCPPPPLAPITKRLFDAALLRRQPLYRGLTPAPALAWQTSYERYRDSLYRYLQHDIRAYIRAHPDLTTVSFFGLLVHRHRPDPPAPPAFARAARPDPPTPPTFARAARPDSIDLDYFSHLSHYGGHRNLEAHGLLTILFHAWTPAT